jgi:surface protein
MFNNCQNFNQPLGSWNVSGVTSMISMLNSTSLSVNNYNNILTGWTGWNGITATKSVKPNVVFGAFGRKYSASSPAADARNYLLTVKNWTITDGGPI